MGNENRNIKGTGRERVYNFIVEFIMQNGYSPSIEEICVGSGLSSKSSVHDYLRMLQMMGKIDMKKYAARTIRLVGYKLVKVDDPALVKKEV